jgi:hypothetical protein
MTDIETLDRPPPGWHTLDVARTGPKWDWVALMIDMHPDDFKNYRRGGRTVREAWVRIPGKHRNKEAAWDALQEMLETRH